MLVSDVRARAGSRQYGSVGDVAANLDGYLQIGDN